MNGKLCVRTDSYKMQKSGICFVGRQFLYTLGTTKAQILCR